MSAQPLSSPSEPWRVSSPGFWHSLRQGMQNWRLSRFHRQKITHARRHLKKLAKLAEFNDSEHRKQLYYHLRSLDPLEFEEIILEAFYRLGNPIRRNLRYTGDGGIDGRVKIEGKWALIQCKRYRDTIQPQHVQDFAHVLRKHRSTLGLFVHTGRTGDLSRSHAQASATQILFVSGDRLCRLLAACAHR